MLRICTRYTRTVLYIGFGRQCVHDVISWTLVHTCMCYSIQNRFCISAHCHYYCFATKLIRTDWNAVQWDCKVYSRFRFMFLLCNLVFFYYFAWNCSFSMPFIYLYAWKYANDNSNNTVSNLVISFRAQTYYMAATWNI